MKKNNNKSTQILFHFSPVLSNSIRIQFKITPKNNEKLFVYTHFFFVSSSIQLDSSSCYEKK